ncbi:MULTISPECIES: membrane dipeptidase [Metallosphaera]|uniref:Peptidase M19, renal dipeptidase n=3 Tax=Metallosphaera TaxID=41980 RepID=A4YFL5_METS5|nr:MULTISPECIES: membrane dipeptidase [Metallosphaera]ABP95217.1 peptidase M19, renal dipeptidase [Metallosphaera sedula DSM 5348]AIM27203.1 peptidase M19, renal dipeptidase [Metallosphaera sedula]AKV74099.1 peptidase [Metallosphaera sedula]AKV76339.1 peptidase [Metallosphaera sedula]AKV78590.1 peptidase [Metallosphaera sedula]
MKFVDLHEDLAYSNQMGIDVIEGDHQSSLKLLRNFDSLVFASLFPHVNTRDERSDLLTSMYGYTTHSTTFSWELLMDQIKFYLYLERKGLVKVIRSREDLSAPVTKLLLSLEGADVLRDYTDIYILRELHVRNLGLTWNYDNKFASSCMSRKDYGLTSEGEELVKLANSLGIIVDLAHAGKRTVMDVASITRKPVIVSHGNVMKLKTHRRNLDDEEIEAVVRTKGVIGVTAIVSTLREPTLQGLVENLRYIGESYGWEYVSLGTDFLGIEKTPEGFDNVLKVNDLLKYVEGHEEEVLWKNAMRVIMANMV